MADYYPILARAVSRLATNNAQARHEVYEHARTILVAQLGSQNPKASALNIMSERVALKGAILRVETKSPSIRGTSSETLADYVPLQMNYQLNGTSEKICLRIREVATASTFPFAASRRRRRAGPAADRGVIFRRLMFVNAKNSRDGAVNSGIGSEYKA